MKQCRGNYDKITKKWIKPKIYHDIKNILNIKNYNIGTWNPYKEMLVSNNGTKNDMIKLMKLG